MQIQQTRQQMPQKAQSLQSNSKRNSDIAFKGGENIAWILKFLDTNPAWGATAVDTGCMGIPRTAVDFTRSPDAGTETARREFSSTINNAALGVYGIGAATILAHKVNNDYKIKANKMFISDEMLNILGQIRHESGDLNDTDNLNKYLNTIFTDVKGFNPDYNLGKTKDQERVIENGWVALDAETKKIAIEDMANEIKTGPIEMTKATKEYFKSLLSNSVEAESKFKLEKIIIDKPNAEKESEHFVEKSISSVSDFIDSVYKTSKTFLAENVVETFKANATEKNILKNDFINRLKGLNKGIAIFGIGTSVLIGLGIQPLNMYLTRKKTGKTGFVGVEGKEQDNSTKFKLIKTAVAGLALYGVIASIGKNILGKVQFKGLTPTTNQFKLVYGATIISRVLSARDSDELRETTIKDSLGFVNWLILGGFVSKLVAAGVEKMNSFKGEKFIRYVEEDKDAGALKKGFNWLTKSTIVTRDEVLHAALKGKTIDKKTKAAMTFKKMMVEAAKVNPEAVKKVKMLGLIQLSGYLYSGIVLGIGIPKLNIAITKAYEKRRKTKEVKPNVQPEITANKAFANTNLLKIK